MKQLRAYKPPYRLLILPVFVALMPLLMAWGIFGHEHINRAAVFALPDSPLKTFFYNHIDFITQEATVPDIRKHTLVDKAEGPRHYINIERYGAANNIPEDTTGARLRYGQKLEEYGYLPWYIQTTMDRLTKAMKERRKTEILFLAADLGHYIGDAHMPLHTTKNHDGDSTKVQKGIHALWEAQLADMFGPGFNFHTAEAQYISDIKKETWNIIWNSKSMADSVLRADMDVRKSISPDDIFRKDKDGKVVKNQFDTKEYSQAYAKAFNSKLNGMVERQMRKAIAATACYWYTAWVNAGKPDLSTLDPAALTESHQKQMQEETAAWKQGQLINLQSEKEY